MGDVNDYISLLHIVKFGVNLVSKIFNLISNNILRISIRTTLDIYSYIIIIYT